MVKSNKHWSQVQETGTILGIRTLLFIYRILGRAGFKIILFPVISYYYLSNKTARQASCQYLDLLRPYLGEEQADSLSSFKHFLHFADMILDKLLVWMGKLGQEQVVFETPSVIEDMDNSGKGGLLIVSHLGNVEVCNALKQKMSEVKLTILVNTQHAEKINSLMAEFGGDSHAKLLQVNDMSPATAMLLADRISAGELVVIAGDRTPKEAGRVSVVEFLGKPAPMPQGAFILASLLKCPVYLMFCLKQHDKYHVYVELFSQQITFIRKQRQQQLNQVVQDYALRLQHYCIMAPLQWFNFFPFWQVTDLLEGSDKQ